MNPNRTRSLLPNLFGLCLLWLQSFTTIALGQITPDQSLGAESSTVRSNVEVRGGLADRIEGGAIRANNLFHSFSDFNILANQRAYFSSPAGIQNILTRVTGANSSLILGTLGVDGLANLFLMNPNGIVFGPNAKLDIQGAFSASTGTAFSLGSQRFDARNPNAAPLVTVNIPIGIQFAADAPARLRNEGELRADRGLTLAAGSVDSVGNLVSSQGAVTVEAVTGDARVDALRAQSAIVSARGNVVSQDSQLQTTGNLTLQAGNTVRIRDSVAKPVVVNTGGDLVVQGNQGVDILALNHAGTPFQSGGNLTLVSDGVVSGDSHFASVGNFSILNQAGNTGQFVSFYDPIIRSSGNVVFASYSGTSLLVEAVGSITVTNGIAITGPDAGSTDARLVDNAALILRSGVAGTLNQLLPDPTPDIVGLNRPPLPDPPPNPIASDIQIGGNISTADGNADPAQRKSGRVDIQANQGNVTLAGTVTAHREGTNEGRVSIVASNGSVNLAGAVTAQGQAGNAGQIILRSGGAGNATNIGANVTAEGAGTITSDSTVNLNTGTVTGNLTGGAGNDVFNFNGGTLAGALDGGTGTNTIGGNNATADTFALVNATQIQLNGTPINVSNIQRLDGRGGADIIQGTGGDDVFALTDATEGTVAGLQFANFEDLRGGGGGNNTLQGTDNVDRFTLTALDAGTIAPNGGTAIAFQGMQTLQGRNGDDIFVINGGSSSNPLDGGDGANTIAGQDAVADAFVLVDADTVSVNATNVNFTNIQTFSGGTGLGDNLTGTNTTAETFTFNNQNSGQVVSGANIFNFNAFETLNGGTDGNNILQGTNNADIFNITGANSGTIQADGGTAIVFQQMQTLQGRNGNDTFVINGGSSTNSLDGGGDNNTIAGRDAVADAFVLVNAATVSVNTSNINFTNIQNFSGGTGIGDSLTGTNTNAETFIFNNQTGGQVASGANTFNFNEFETLDGGTDTTNSLEGTNNTDTFNITGANSGSIQADGGAAIVFSQMQTLRGRGNDDTFAMAGGSITNPLEGGGGTNTIAGQDLVNDVFTLVDADTINLNGININFSQIQRLDGRTGNDTVIGTAANETFSLGASLAGFQLNSIETLDGGGGLDILEGSGGNDTFTIAIVGVNQGTLNGTTAFRNFETLKGQGGNDTFNFTVGSFGGTVEGNDDNDTFAFLGGSAGSALEGGGGTNTIVGSDLVNDVFSIVNSTTLNVNGTAVTFNQVQRLDGGLGSDSVVGTNADEVFSFGTPTLGGFQLNSIENLNGGGGSDTLEGSGGNDIFTITGINSGCVAIVCNALTNNFSSIENLSGLGGNDAFTLGAFTSLSGNINGGDGDDTVSLSAFSSVIGTVAGDAGRDTFNLPVISTIGTLSGGADADTINFSGGTVITARGDEGNDTFNFIAGTSSAAVQGNAGDDTFTFASAAVLNGTIDGGIDNNSLSYTTYASPVAVDLQAKTATGITQFDSIQRIQGSGSLFDQISGTDADETFSFPGAGAVSGIELSSFETIDGRGGNDTFILNALGTATNLFGGDGDDKIQLNGGTITGLVNGGSGILTIEGNTLAGLPTTAGSITGSGSNSSIVIQPINPSAAIGVNRTTGSGFELTPSFFPLVNAATFRDMTIGHMDGTGAVTVSSTSTNPFNLNIDTIIQGGGITTVGDSGINSKGNDLTFIANTSNIDTTNNIIVGNPDLSGADAGSIQLIAKQGFVNTRGLLAQAFGLGNGGNISLNGNSVNITLQGSDTIDTYSSGDGSTGNTSITANTGNVTITGQGSSGIGASRNWSNRIWADRRGAGISDSTKGNISIKSSSGNISVTGTEFNLLIGDQSAVGDTQVSEGGGKLILNAQQGQIRLNDSRVFTGTELNSKGNGANVDILSNSFRLEGNSILEATVSGSGQGGNIAVQSQSINITPGSSIKATVLSSGNAGTIALKGSNTIQIQGTTIETTVNSGAIGNGGSVQIQGGDVTVAGTTVTADTAGAGNAGSVTIEGNRVTLDATTTLAANTTGAGKAGAITIQGNGPSTAATPALAVNGSKISSSIGPGSKGAGGSITLAGTNIALTDAKITASNAGSNTGSSVTIGTNTTTSTTLTNTEISTTATGTATNTANIGNVTVLGQSIALSGTTQINADNDGAANAGTVQIGGATTGPLTLTQTGNTSLISTQVTGSGSGSNVALNGAAITLTGQGPGTPTAIIDATTRSGNASSQGGSVALTATGGNLQLQIGAEIKTTTSGAAQGGNISLTAAGTASLADQSQLNATSSGSGKGGAVTIAAANLALTQGSTVNTSTSGSGNGGDVALSATGQISLKDASKVNATTSGSGNAGDVSITAATLVLQGNATPGFPSDPINPALPNANRSEIITRASETSTGAAGNITIKANVFSLNYAALLADTRQRANSNQGNITITGASSGNLTLDNESLVSAIGSGGVRGGNITVEGFGLIQGGPVTGPNGSDFTTNADGAGLGGIILFKGAPINFRRQKSVPGNTTNDISSNGQIQLQDPGLEKGLKTLDVVFVDPNQLVGQDCQQAIDKPEGSSRFSIAGRGGVPANPTAPLAAEAEDSDWVSLNRPIPAPGKPAEPAAQINPTTKSAQLVPRKDRQCISSLWSDLYRH
jgi:filamentous hemagglutinin family protein